MPSETEESEEEMKKFDFVSELLPPSLSATANGVVPPLPAHSASIFELLKLKMHNGGTHKRDRTPSSTSTDFIAPSTTLQHLPLDFRTSS